MIRLRAIVLSLVALPAIAQVQTSTPTKSAPKHPPSGASSARVNSPDFSREPLVIERFTTVVDFHNDGTSDKTVSARIRVQSDAAAQQLSQLTFPFHSPDEENEIHFVRIQKPDGKIITLRSEAIKETIAEVVRDAPAFSGVKKTSVTVPALTPGDILEYEVTTRVTASPAPQTFWFAHRFLDDAVVLSEKLSVSIPAARTVKIESPKFLFVLHTDEAHGRTIYTWTHTHLSSADANSENESSGAPQAQRLRPPNVEVTSFSDWQQVARWYSQIEHDRATPTPVIAAKATELTHSSATNTEKIAALYDYVSKNIRYVPLPFGQGPYSSHTADEIFANQYGDSNDKAVLLAALLESIGIHSSVALVPSTRQLDAGLPSPAQFDHVVNAVPDGDTLLWLDTTAEVAPFRMLAASLRDKSALLIPESGPASITKTPADPPFPSTQDAFIKGRVSELGKLTARIHYALRGDTELLLRVAFQRTPQEQWPHLAETILNLDGIHGSVTGVSPGDPADTKNPFQLDIDFAQVNFLDWFSASQRVALPLAALGLPDAPADKSQAITLGSPLSVTTKITLALPASFTAQPPTATAVSQDYADYHSSYHFADHTLTAERSLSFKLRELPASRAADYAAFAHAVQTDENQKFLAVNPAAGSTDLFADATPDELFESGSAALESGNARAALPLLQRVVALDPHHKKNAYDDIGLAYFRLGELAEAASAFREQIAINPQTSRSYEYLGVILQQQHQNDQAAIAFRKQLEINPLDKAALAALGAILLDGHDYPSAVLQLEKATILSPDNAGLFVRLGQAYAGAGDGDKAVAAFHHAAALSPSPRTLNDIALNLADNKLALADAHKYATAAVSQTEVQLHDPKLSDLKPADLALTEILGDDWGTLGWVDLQEGDFDAARRYLTAAWLLNGRSATADHLAQFYVKRGDKKAATHLFMLSLAAPHADPETRARLTLLLGGNSSIDALVAQAQPELESLRTLSLGKLLDEDAAADFLILLSPGRKTATVDSVEFTGGNKKLKSAADRLRLLHYGAVFPSASPAKIVRRATLTCSAAAGTCSLRLALPSDAPAN